ncbi:RNA 2',3'-cyclic phosphodiesterase [Actinoallomurus rhizosphaericola]|uniref:RNA 2',3'-cyclic phosphodiesterase n=1 Tax=Actinoallomurus rhizosphaericola TaxID=2952536 RepID=UPI002090D5D6|nr:RNA 2',3'-cyclic phosphodiesterase [Actinoallomurus rhizosphaericola]MCO5993125.1 RNA 2',3'-cyclic phosphodiesterase [Actinoallomurus rhizosphaericola]
MRLFVALLPPANVLDEVEAAFAPHRAAHPDLRWTRRPSWHVTLAFYGEVDEQVVPRILPRLERAAGRHPRRELAFAGAGAFPRPASARVLWTGVEADLRRLADSCVAAARREGVDVDEHKRFHPHLTMARARDPLDLRSLVAELRGYEGSPWTAEEINLVRSHLGPRARYETLGAWPLA